MVNARFSTAMVFIAPLVVLLAQECHAGSGLSSEPNYDFGTATEGHFSDSQAPIETYEYAPPAKSHSADETAAYDQEFRLNLSGVSSASDSDSRIKPPAKSLRSRIESTKTRIEETEKKISDSNSSLSKEKNSRASKSRELATLLNRLKSRESKLKSINKKIARERIISAKIERKIASLRHPKKNVQSRKVAKAKSRSLPQ